MAAMSGNGNGSANGHRVAGAPLEPELAPDLGGDGPGPVAVTADLLRVATAGSVDDGKSTLIGRLLYDSKQILEDQLASVERTSRERGKGDFDLSLLTDGLRAEREQGITIDVAYRFFATPRRRFILADTPGHVQYTRNMVTGASTAHVSLVLVDARSGLVEQSLRHLSLSALLGIRHVVLCVNKMDLVDFSEATFRSIADEFERVTERLGIPEGVAVPMSALNGDNVVDRSPATPWYDGPALLQLLEELDVAADRPPTGRFPVQYVIRHGETDYRGYAGRVAGGVLRPGDEVTVLPSGAATRIAGVDTLDGELDAAEDGASVTLRLEDELDVGRGDMIVSRGEEPGLSRQIEATLCWMSDRPLTTGGRYAIKHTTRTARAVVDQLLYRLDVPTLEHREGPESFELNDIGHVRLRVSTPLAADPYEQNRTTGSFILIDEATNATVAGGMVTAAGAAGD